MSAKPNGIIEAKEHNLIDHFDAGETISEGDAVALDYSDYKIYKASAAAFNARLNFIGFAMENGALDSPIQVNTRTYATEKTGLTANTTYYLSDTQGAISTSAGTIERQIGRSVSTSEIIRKRGVVSPPISQGSATAPCDLYAQGKDAVASASITTDGVTVGGDYSTGVFVRMGDTFSFGGSFSDTFVTLLDSLYML